MNWEEFDKKVDLKGLNDEIKNAEADNGGEFERVPDGVYEVGINKLELKQSKKGDPMVVCYYKILAGQYKNRLIFQHQVITRGFQIHIANELLRSLDTGVNIEFATYSQYDDLIMDVKEAIDAQKLEYALNYGKNDKGFDTFKIEEVFSNN